MIGPRHTAAVTRRAVALLGLAACCSSAATARAQAAKITLEADRHIARVGEPFSLTVQIVVQGRDGYDRYAPPNFGKAFQVSAGGMTTQNIEIINWQVRRRESHTYTVVPLSQGTQTVGPAAVIVGGRRYSSNRVTVQVRQSAGGGAPAPAPADPGVQGGDPSDASDAPPAQVPAERANERVFIAAVAAPKQVYLGQQVVVTWYLFTQSDVLGFHTVKQPTTDNFWAEDLRSPRRLVFDRRSVGGRTYYAAVIARKALFPQQTGKLTVGPMGAQVRTLQHFASAAAVLESEAVELEVLPLPTAGQPAGFASQNVGQFELATTMDRTRVKAGEGVTLKLVVNGQGNVRHVKLPELSQLDGFKVYKPTVDERLTLEGGVSGEKVLNYLLMPTRSGNLQVPALHLDYFDPLRKQYRRSSSQPLRVTVTGRLPQAQGDGAAGAKNVIGVSIRPPRPARSLENHEPSGGSMGRALFVLLTLLPAGFVVLWGVGERIRWRLRRETPGSLRRAASRHARGHLARAQEFSRSGELAAFHGELAAGLRSVLDYRLGRPIEGLTRPALRQELSRAGFAHELVEQVIDALEQADAARFAPGAADAAEMGAALDRVRRLVDQLGRARAQGGPS